MIQTDIGSSPVYMFAQLRKDIFLLFECISMSLRVGMETSVESELCFREWQKQKPKPPAATLSDRN